MEQRNKENRFIFPFEKLEVWWCGIDLTTFILNLVESFPANRYHRLIDQLVTAASSVAQNIAEGKGRQYKREFIQFLYIAEGSLFEVLTLIGILKRMGLIKEQEETEIKRQAEIIDRKLHGLINSLRRRV